MSNVEKLKAKLESIGGHLAGLTLGDNPGSAEEIAGAILESLEALEQGKGTVVADI